MRGSSRRARSLVVTALVLSSLLGLTNWIYTRSLLERRLNQSLQSRTNRSFVLEHASLAEAMESYPGVWPPAYPMGLRTASELGFPLRRVNQLLFYVGLGWIFWWLRRNIAEIHWGWPLLFFCLAAFHYEVMSQLVPENLFVPLALFFFSATMRYSERRSSTALAELSLLCAAACATKYIGLFWLLPIGTMQILLTGPAERRTRLLHLAAFVLASVLPVGVWMGYQYDKTGFLTGIDRFEAKAEAAANADLTTFGANVSFTVKSVVLDFFSISRSADHTTINHPYQPDWALYAFAGLIAGIVLANRQGIRRWVGSAPDRAGAWWRDPCHELRRSHFSSTWVMGGLVATYKVVLIALWTVGNNDPIYSRFVYPTYPFLVLLGFTGYARVRASGELSAWARASFWVFYGLLLLVHVYKTVILQHVVHTPAWS